MPGSNEPKRQLTSGSSWSRLHAQNIQDGRMRLLQADAEFREFHQRRAEFEQAKKLERIRIPQYNISLAEVLYKFHSHISDMHHRHVSCTLCREHVKKIKDMAKKIDQGMK